MTHGSKALDEDAAKLRAIGFDPGPTLEELFGVPEPTARSANYANAGGRQRNAALPKEVKGQRGKLYGKGS